MEDSLWDKAIANAKAVGIDGFALNTGPEDAQLEALHKAYTAGERNGFGMFISFDMVRNSTYWNWLGLKIKYRSLGLLWTMASG